MTYDYTKMLKALGDETRFKIFEMLKGGSLCACKILDKLNITQPTLSHHMKIMCDSGIINYEKVGIWAHYSINTQALTLLLKNLDTKSY